MFGKMRRLKGQAGFSMAEVVAATMLFVASVVGISSMLVSGGANVNKGAVESTASNLASRKIEEVKTLPFYVPFDYVQGDKDIDDTYFNGSYANGVQAQEDQHPQLDHPVVVEDYGTIPGQPRFKRTTAIEYQYLSNIGGTDHLAPAVMTTGWTPSDPSGNDKPRGGADASVTDDLHALLIEVCVYYNIDNIQHVYKERALAGDLLVTGGSNNPIIVITSIDPVTGTTDNPHMNMTIYTDAVSEFGPSSTVNVKLWRAGTQEIFANGEAVNASGTQVTCWFDFTPPEVEAANDYSVSLEWADRGFTAQFRNCFNLIAPPPTITSITSNNWGYRRQTARQVTINGTGLNNASLVRMLGPYPTNGYTINSGAITTNTPTQIVTTFNLVGDAVSRPNNTRWSFEITTPGGTIVSDTTAKRLLMNPQPTITAITASSPPNYYNWGWKTQAARKVRIQGNYLYGFDTPADKNAILTYSSGTYNTSQGTFVSGQNGNGATATGPLVLEFSPTSAFPDGFTAGNGYHAEVHGTRWDVKVQGDLVTTPVSSDQDSERFLMNPAPVVTGITGLINGYRKTGVVSTITIDGQYFQDSVGFYMLNNGGAWSPNTVIVPMSGGSINSAGTQWTGIQENLNKEYFINWQTWTVEPGTSSNFNNINYRALLQNGNYDWQSVWPGNTTDFQHAPIAVTSSPSGYQNDWNQSIGQVTGNYFDTTQTTIACTTNPEGVNTLSGTVTVNGAYGVGQTLNNTILYNAINMAPGTYTIRLTDNENGRYSDRNFTISSGTPILTSYSMASGTDGVTYNNVKVYGRRLYSGSGLQVRMHGPGAERYCDHGTCCWFSACATGDRGKSWYKYSSGDTIVASRAGQSVYDNHTITLEAKSTWSHSHCSWPCGCSHSGWNQDPTREGDDVDEIIVSGPWGWSNAINPAVNIVD